MDKKLKPVTDYKAPQYPQIEGFKKREDADCTGSDVCTTSLDHYETCYNGIPAMRAVYKTVGCTCQDSQCECGDAWYDWF